MSIAKEENDEEENKTLNSTQSRMALLSKDLNMNIFSRLPSKSVGKSKCVCKEWRAIISDPFFKSLHRERSSLKSNVLLLHVRYLPFSNNHTVIAMSSVDFDGNLSFDYTFTVSASVFGFMPSIGELICFVSNEGIHVCNPSTREFVNLPKTNRVFGAAFGYLKERNEYVLLCVGRYKRCEVMRWTDDCCLTDRSWKVVDAECPYLVSLIAVLVGKCFFWIGYVREKYDELLIVSFDLEEEEFGMLVPPENPNKGQILVELKGMLCLADVVQKRSTMNIWVLKDFKNCIWVKEYTIDLSMSNHGTDSWNMILYHREGKFLMDVSSKSLEWYDVENKCVKRIHYHNGISQGWRWSGLYTDGLFSLGSLWAT